MTSAAETIDARLEAHRLGRDAGLDGCVPEDNPHPAKTGLARSWERGRAEGEKDLRERQP